MLFLFVFLRTTHGRQPLAAVYAWLFGILASLPVGCERSEDDLAHRTKTIEKPVHRALVEQRGLEAESSCDPAAPLKPGIPGSPGHLIATEINPNGQSELAWLMRRMADDLRSTREDMLAGRKTTLSAPHQRIRCSWPTATSDREPPFDVLAVDYLARVEAFGRVEAPTADDFDRVVEGCAQCHQQTCDGPLQVIEALYIHVPGGLP